MNSPYSCEAFAVIPDDILFNRHDHSKPYPGDNGILFELKDGLEPLGDDFFSGISGLQEIEIEDE